jgi:signal transduction histidine kinase
MNAMRQADLPVLDGDEFARAFPFYLLVDAELRVRSAGASFRKTCPALQIGMPLQSLFTIRRPRAIDCVETWRLHLLEACTLVSLNPPAMTLRGSAGVHGDGLLLLVAPVLTSLDDVTRLGLNFNDFAKHDASFGSLLLAQTTHALKQDAEQMAERLRGRTEELATMMELSRHGVVYFNALKLLQHTNTALLEMLGLQRSTVFDLDIETLDKWLGGLLADDEACRRPLAALMVGTDNSSMTGGRLIQLKLPRPITLRFESACTTDGGWVFYFLDVTHEMEVDRMKHEFLETAAHELRTPMTSVYGFTELLLSRPIPQAQQRDMLKTIQHHSKYLINMVNEMLDLTRITARQGRDLKREPCRLGKLIDEMASLFVRPGIAEQLQISSVHSDTVLDVDAEKIVRALTNVLSNAFKYSPEGGAVKVDTRSGMLHEAAAIGLCVTDHGIGMTPQQQARVFERFYRVDASGNIPGTGLGMSLVKEIIELHGGHVEICSELGKGAAVTLWLPVGRNSSTPD